MTCLDISHAVDTSALRPDYDNDEKFKSNSDYSPPQDDNFSSDLNGSQYQTSESTRICAEQYATVLHEREVPVAKEHQSKVHQKGSSNRLNTEYQSYIQFNKISQSNVFRDITAGPGAQQIIVVASGKSIVAAGITADAGAIQKIVFL